MNNNNNETVMIRDDNDKDKDKHDKRIAYYFLTLFILIGVGCIYVVYYAITLITNTGFVDAYFPISMFVPIILIAGGLVISITCFVYAHETFVNILEMK